MTIQGFHHVAIQVRDVEKVSRFYTSLLGLPELQRYFHPDGSLRSVWVGVTPGAGAEAGFLAVEQSPADTPDGVLGFSMVALRIAPNERLPLEARLTAAGVEIEKRTGWTSYVRDPEGNLIGLSHHPHPAS